MKTEATGSLIAVNIDGKPLEKLIEVVSNGIGTLYRPRRIRKEADAQAYAITVLEKAKSVASSEAKLLDAETAERIENRMVAQEIRRQKNIDTVVEAAAEELKGKEVSEEPVDEDWATRFFGIVQDISREEMKILWSKILAKEVERPSSFSMRTLETLRNMSSQEAALFEKLSSLVLEQCDLFIFRDTEALERYGFPYVDIAQLVDRGILQPGDFVLKNYQLYPGRETKVPIICGKQVILLNLPRGSGKLEVPVIPLSQVGRELYGLLEPKTNMNYIRDFARHFKKKNNEVRLQYADLITIEGDMVRYKDPLVDL